MMHIPFVVDGEFSPVREIKKEIVGFSIEQMQNGVPVSLEIARRDGSALRITNKMHDIFERTEIGCLSFKVVKLSSENNQFNKFYRVELKNFIVLKLSYFYNGISVDCGVLLKEYDNKNNIIICPGVYPYSLFIEWPGVVNMGDMEYEFSEYKLSKYN
ncbi:hypothetical protein [Methylobacterium indicum]|uniref:hypothetical protein n=1 Tax=Methylobacterium indicum TaxID=1775910 RepID=UPI000AED4DD1|nr:hypothetical protein [Methylobacterium indicum]